MYEFCVEIKKLISWCFLDFQVLFGNLNTKVVFLKKLCCLLITALIHHEIVLISYLVSQLELCRSLILSIAFCCRIHLMIFLFKLHLSLALCILIDNEKVSCWFEILFSMPLRQGKNWWYEENPSSLNYYQVVLILKPVYLILVWFWNQKNGWDPNFGKSESLVGLENPAGPPPRGTHPHGGLQTVQTFAFTKGVFSRFFDSRTKPEPDTTRFQNQNHLIMLRELMIQN